MSTSNTNKLNTISIIVLNVILLCVLAFSIHQIFQSQMIGIDYMFTWHAGRVFFVDGGDIYSPAVGAQNQLWVYGRPALPGEDDLNFAYPPYILIFLAPLVILRYDWSQAVWMAANLLLLLNLGLFFFSKTPKWIPITLILFYPVYFTVIIGNTALLISLLLIVTIYNLFFKTTVSPRSEFILGVFLAFTTGKPQLVWFFIILIFFYCITRKRWHLILGFILNFAFMNIISFTLYPSWPIHWIYNTISYSKEGGIAPTLVWYLSMVFSEAQASALYIVLFLLSLPLSAFILWIWNHKKFDTLSLICYVAYITNLFDPSSLTPDKTILLVPLFIWAVQNPGEKSVKITWIAGIFLTNAAFITGQLTEFKLAVDVLPILFFTAWLIYIMLTRRKNFHVLSLRTRELSG